MDPLSPLTTLPTPRPTTGTCRAVPFVLGVAALAAAYAVAGYVGIEVSYFESHVTLLWPPTGIAVGVLYRFGYRYWPGVFLGALVVEATTLPFGVAAGVAVGNSLAPAAAVWALRRVRYRPAIESQADVVRLVTAGAFVPMLVSATNGVSWLCWGEVAPWSRYWDGWWVWWVGDSVGVLIFATPILSFPRSSWAALGGWAGAGRFAGTVAGVLGVSLVCHGWLGDEMTSPMRLTPVPALAVLWAALRRGLWSGSVCLVVVAAVAVGATSRGVGPFHHANPGESLVHLSGYLTVLTMVLLLMTSVISERDAAGRRLAASEELYRTLVEGNPAMICRLGPDGVVTYVNETYLRTTRQPAERVVGRPFLDGSAAEDRRRIADALAALRGGAAPAALELLAPGGRMRWHKWTLRAVAGPTGAMSGFEAVGLDVTDRRRAEDERRAIEEQMYHTQKLESLGVMAGGVAHDFNNLLTGIIGHAELAAEDRSAGPAVRSHLAQVTETARRAADLTRQLLAYAGKGRLAVRPFDLNAVIRDTAGLVGVSIPKKCVLRFEPGPDPVRVSGDEVQLRQVVMNLLINAGEAVGDRPGLIRVRTDVTDLDAGQITDSLTRSTVLPGRYARLRVSDTGCGMDEATKAKIFEPFFTTKFTGRGLGLAAVHGIVRAHHGLIEVVSEPGRGTEFAVLLPYLPAEPHSDRETLAEIPTPLPAVRPPATRETSTAVLVVDDEEAVLAVAREVLEHAGWDVETASTGRDGLAAFRRDPPRYQVLVVDLTMPGLDGLELLAEVRRVRADVPVILCTGFGAETVPDLSRHAPARVLNKPFRSSELIAAVAGMAHASETVKPSASRSAKSPV